MPITTKSPIVRRLTVKTAAKAGAISSNHTAARLVVKTATKAGFHDTPLHNTRRLTVKTATRAGAISANHTVARLVVKIATKAGGKFLNHAVRRLVVE